MQLDRPGCSCTQPGCNWVAAAPAWLQSDRSCASRVAAGLQLDQPGCSRVAACRWTAVAVVVAGLAAQASSRRRRLAGAGPCIRPDTSLADSWCRRQPHATARGGTPRDDRVTEQLAAACELHHLAPRHHRPLPPPRRTAGDRSRMGRALPRGLARALLPPLARSHARGTRGPAAPADACRRAPISHAGSRRLSYQGLMPAAAGLGATGPAHSPARSVCAGPRRPVDPGRSA